LRKPISRQGIRFEIRHSVFTSAFNILGSTFHSTFGVRCSTFGIQAPRPIYRFSKLSVKSSLKEITALNFTPVFVVNPFIAGVFPFEINFFNWARVSFLL